MQSASHALLLSRLPDVMLQSIMLPLQAREILLFARTCRHFMRVTSSHFAFSRTTPLRLFRWMQTLSSHIPAPGPLLRFIPVCLQLESAAKATDEEVASVLLCARTVRIVEIDLQLSHALSDPHAARIFQDERMDGLRSVTIRVMTPELLRVLCQLPALRRLTSETFTKASADWDVLETAPALEVLSAVDGQDASCFPAASRCKRLRRLTVQLPHLPAGSFLEFATAPAMANLQELVMSTWTMRDAGPLAQPPTTEEFAQGFPFLRSLHTLELIHPRFVDEMVNLLHHLPALRCCVIQPLHLWPHSMPTSKDLLALLDAREQLHVRLQSLSLRGAAPSAEAKVFRRQLKALVKGEKHARLTFLSVKG